MEIMAVVYLPISLPRHVSNIFSWQAYLLQHHYHHQFQCCSSLSESLCHAVEVLEKVGAGCLKAQQNGNFIQFTVAVVENVLHFAVAVMENVLQFAVAVVENVLAAGN